MAEAGQGKKVCVTGASGYIASWIVKLLLDRGYTVNATVRSLNDPEKVEHLLALDGAKDRLFLFEANLSDEGSYDSAVHGCIGVFHTASPVKFDASNPEEEIIAPAVKGTLYVLASCAKVPSIKRVVITSSIAAVLLTGRPLTTEVVVDETWFSSPEFCQDPQTKWYFLSKTLAEDAAWKFAKDNGIDMVSISPGAVLGPFLQSRPQSSAGSLFSMIGSEAYPNQVSTWVHVKDVAEAHILAFETPSAHGRYLLTESVAHLSEVVNILSELYPTLKFPNKCVHDKPFDPIYKVSKEKVQNLGINYIPLKAALKETIECLQEKKFITL